LLKSYAIQQKRVRKTTTFGFFSAEKSILGQASSGKNLIKATIPASICFLFLMKYS